MSEASDGLQQWTIRCLLIAETLMSPSDPPMPDIEPIDPTSVTSVCVTDIGVDNYVYKRSIYIIAPSAPMRTASVLLQLIPPASVRPVATHTGTTDATTISGIGGQYLLENLQQALNILGVKEV